MKVGALVMTVSAAASPRPFTVGVVVHPSKPIAESVDRLTRWVRAQGGVILARDKDRDRIGGDIPTVSDEEFVADVDAVVSLGGDGTMLGRCVWSLPNLCPCWV
jgi:NAD+ kinase